MSKPWSAAVISVFLISAAPAPALSQQDPPHKSCCFWIYSTGVELGGLKSMAYFGRPSLKLETEMVEILFRIGNWAEVANTFCSDLSRAWDNYRAIQTETDTLADLVASGRAYDPPGGPGGERAPSYPRVYNGLPAEGGELEFGLRDVGRRVTPPGREERYVSGFDCEVGYFLIGYHLGFAHHAFNVLQLEGEGTRWGAVARGMALEHIARAIDLVRSVRMTFQQGDNCGRLWLDTFAVLSTLVEIDQERAVRQLSIAQLVEKTSFVRYRIVAGDIFGWPPAQECPGTDHVATAKGNRAAAGWLRPQDGLTARKAAMQRRWAVPPVPTTIDGSWDWFNGRVIEIRPGGVAIDPSGEYQGSWVVKGGRTFVITWSQGGKAVWVDTLELSADGQSLSGQNQVGNAVSARRRK
jgi:hypothetical protein